MRGKRLFSVLLSGLMLMPAVPAQASMLRQDAYIFLVDRDDVYDLQPGDMIACLDPEADDWDYWIEDWSVSSNISMGKSYSYSITLRGKLGSAQDVTVYGAYDVSVTKKSSDKYVVKAKCYPFCRLDTVTNIAVSDDEATWDKVDGAGSYSVIVYYTDKNGYERTSRRTVSGTRVNMAPYKNYSDVTVSVQAKKKSGAGYEYVMESPFVFPDGSIDDTPRYSESYPSIPIASGGIDRNSMFYNDRDDFRDEKPGCTGWQGSGDTWYYLLNGSRMTGWIQPDGVNWYYLRSDGLMLSGWQWIDGRWYYLSQAHDGYFGRMLSGYQNIGGVIYYLNTAHDGTFGAMFENSVTPNGLYAHSGGAVY